ncbi:DUF5389 domain-containing protein [Avibacterium sp. 20-15]|uniref:DUF5389 domain-containing protein n=1 Tax=unclassified Avibacterium TaxID=2685287 RepID=UPI002027002C|nr:MULTISPECIES: DUF5389 domain-containing protein [unclassified Avibacterium]MCW9733208.1 DUF5389 domain-containing protein [Avibacterium sp. 20-15]URL05325.1 DUF5389 domain-containing protein [Avibacterium sp. 20-132]
MNKQKMPTGFSPFTWALAIFCLPILLWPLALLISPNLLKNPSLSDLQITLMSIFFWVYPLILGISARILYLIHQRNAPKAKGLLLLSAVIFYAILSYICVVGFST